MRIAVLFAAALTLLGATCVQNVQQRGDAGPWVGEVVNTGDQTVNTVSARARVRDQRGREYYPGGVSVLACPSKLLPGERGAFELFLPTENQNPDYVLADPVLPYRAEFDALAHENVGAGPARSDGFHIEELSRDRGARTIDIRLTNNGPGAYNEYTVCGIVRDADGAIAEVGRADGPPLPSQLAVGESIDLTMHFNALSEGSFSVRFHALGLLNAPYTDCCPLGASTWYSVDLRWFSVLLPPDWRYEPAQGVDSFVGRFVGPGVTLEFDYGAFSNDLPYDDGSAYGVHFETIGGRPAKVVVSKAANGVTGVHLDAIPQGQFSTSALTVAGSDLTPAQQQIAMQIFRSIRICECVVR